MHNLRIIKFRGKRIDNGEWIYGSLLVWENGDCEIIVQNSPIDCDKISVGADTVGQFTGLLDKNGKEIYEGDLSQDKIGRISVCEFHHGGYWVRTIEALYSERLHSDSQIDIISNIHNNPELLKGGKE